MKPLRLFIVCLLLFIVTAGSAQLNGYKSYKGSIDKYPVTMNLCKTGHKFFGYFYYDLYQVPVYFIGEDTSEKGNIKLTSFLPNPDITENFLFKIKDNAITGEWHTTGKDKSLKFFAEENNTSLSFDLIYTRGSIKLRPKMTESPVASFEAASVWPRGNSTQAIFLKKLVNEAFGQKNSTEDIGQTFLHQKKKYLDRYLKDNKDLKDEDLKDTYAYNYEQRGQLMIVFQSSRLLTFAGLSDSYTGGAHDNYGTSFSSVDLTSNKKLKLDDIITSAGKKQLSKLLEKYFRKTYSLKDTDSLGAGGLFENKIEPNNNFYVTEKGIGFNYVPYEIGPFSMGEINIFIPFSELKNYLRPAFRKLIE